jgi:hypothetical protein
MTLATTDLRDFPPVAENIERPDTLRQSLLARHDKCPRSAYLAQKYDTASVAMDRGTAFHAFVERAIQTMRDQDETTMPGEQARELADAVMAEATDLVLPTEEQDAVRLMAWNWAESFVLDWDTIVGVEVPLSMELGGFTLTGRVDLIEAVGQTLYVRDWKTSLNIRKREEVQRGFQGQMYALLLLEGVTSKGMSLGAGINDVWFYETYPRYRTDEGTLIAKEGSWARPELMDFKVSLERNLERFADSLETGDWPARDGSWCSTCPAQTECPIPAHLRFEAEITNLAEATDAFSLKLANEREGRRIQSALRGWVQENGPIYVGDYAFDAAATESRIVKDWDQLILALHRTSEVGAPFEMNDHVELRTATKFGKRKLKEEERDAGDE